MVVGSRNLLFAAVGLLGSPWHTLVQLFKTYKPLNRFAPFKTFQTNVRSKVSDFTERNHPISGGPLRSYPEENNTSLIAAYAKDADVISVK